MRVRIFCAALLVLLFAGSSFAQALSKRDLLDLKKSGVADSVLIKQIEKDGISFEMNAATTIELKNLGLSDGVLSALLSSRKPAEKSPPVSQNESVAALYKAGKFPELADHLKATLKANPTDYKTHALLIMTLLKMKEKDAGQYEFQSLSAHEQDPAAAPYIKQVKTLLDTLAKAQEAKDKLLAALKEYRTTDAMAVVDDLPASPTQKEILKLNLDVYQAKFDQARDRFSRIKFSSYAEKERSSKIQDSITQTETTYKQLRDRIDEHLYGEFSIDPCSAQAFSQSYPLNPVLIARGYRSLTAEDFVTVFDKLWHLAPLNENVIDLTFLAELLVGDYDHLELLGDRLLATRGRIRIPFFSSDRFFYVVIDSGSKSIFTEPDGHSYEKDVARGMSNPKFFNYVHGYWADLTPFDLHFDQIAKITQKSGTYAYDMLAKKTYALKFEPQGVAPNYALRNKLFCTVGERAELTATRNLGQYIVHVIRKKDLATEFVDPSKTRGTSSGWTTAALMLGGALSEMGQSSPLNQMAMQGLQAQQAQQISTLQAQEAAWANFAAARDTFNFVEADAFTGLELLLGVLN